MVDEVALARIARERDAAIARYLRGRDATEPEATMRRLDTGEAAAKSPTEAARLAPDEIVGYLRDLPCLGSEASPEARQLIAASLFEETSALGWMQFCYTWTQHAQRR